MWILFKFAAALFAFIYRWFHRRDSIDPKPDLAVTVNGITCHVTPHVHKGRTIKTVLNLDLNCSAIFKLSRETKWDGLFKSLGLSTEIQTGDPNFDQLIYITCDSSAFALELKSDESARKKITDLFQAGATHIEGDGKLLLVTFPGDMTAQLAVKHLAIELRHSLSDIDLNFRGHGRDPFVYKAIAIECLIYSLGAYAFTSYLEWRIMEQTLHLDMLGLASRGLGLGILLTILLLGLIVLLLKGSSRGHRILVESALVLGLSLPISGISLFGDANTTFDKGSPTWVKRGIYRTYSVLHRGRKGTTWHTYHMMLKEPEASETIPIPGTIQISIENYRKAQNKEFVSIELMPGYFGFAWIRTIEIQTN